MSRQQLSISLRSTNPVPQIKLKDWVFSILFERKKVFCWILLGYLIRLNSSKLGCMGLDASSIYIVFWFFIGTVKGPSKSLISFSENTLMTQLALGVLSSDNTSVNLYTERRELKNKL